VLPSSFDDLVSDMKYVFKRPREESRVKR
jgi:hypothetical protein